MSKGLVSVIIPTRDRFSVLRAVKSVFAQSYGDIEVIVVDDGSSTDFSVKSILSEFEGNNRLIVVGYKDSRGSAYARNFGAEHAKGKYITFLDSDDAYLQNCILRQIEVHSRSRANLITYGQGQRAIFEKENLKQKLSVEPTVRKNNDESCARYIFGRNGRMFTPTLFMQKSLFDNILFNENLIRHVDYGFVIDAEMAGASFEFIEEPLFYWISEIGLESAGSKGISHVSTFKFLDEYKNKLDEEEILLFIKNNLTEVCILTRKIHPILEVFKRYGIKIRWFPFILLSFLKTFFKMIYRKIYTVWVP